MLNLACLSSRVFVKASARVPVCEVTRMNVIRVASYIHAYVPVCVCACACVCNPEVCCICCWAGLCTNTNMCD